MSKSIVQVHIPGRHVIPYMDIIVVFIGYMMDMSGGDGQNMVPGARPETPIGQNVQF
jgi:hypothetical protein